MFLIISHIREGEFFSWFDVLVRYEDDIWDIVLDPHKIVVKIWRTGMVDESTHIPKLFRIYIGAHIYSVITLLDLKNIVRFLIPMVEVNFPFCLFFADDHSNIFTYELPFLYHFIGKYSESFGSVDVLDEEFLPYSFLLFSVAAIRGATAIVITFIFLAVIQYAATGLRDTIPFALAVVRGWEFEVFEVSGKFEQRSGDIVGGKVEFFE